jgi:hypothetical protein
MLKGHCQTCRCHLREEESSHTSTFSPSLIHDIHNNPAAEDSNNILHVSDFADITHIRGDGRQKMFMTTFRTHSLTLNHI